MRVLHTETLTMELCLYSFLSWLLLFLLLLGGDVWWNRYHCTYVGNRREVFQDILMASGILYVALALGAFLAYAATHPQPPSIIHTPCPSPHSLPSGYILMDCY